jgi:outer membrane murein-binding lipoprotein Lpp
MAAAKRPGRMAKVIWVGVTLLFGVAAVAATAWHQVQSRAELPAQTAQLREVGSHLDEIGKQLPAGTAPGPEEHFDTFPATIDTLNAKIADLGNRIQALREKTKNREIDPETAAKMADYLRQFGSNRVVVSFVPDDVEAYGYANQIANILRAAGWDALGPEETAIFGNAQGMGVTVYVHAGGQAPAAAKILLDAFARFNIPYKSGITPSEAIPDPATVELFVGHKA